MIIVADENIPCVRQAFGPLGDVRTYPGREITRSAVQDADALLVRSVTRVDEALIDGAALQFIGSATAGVDHVDVDALVRRGVRFASAPGCNAESVAQYVAAVLFHLAGKLEWTLKGRTIGIVGAGHCGSEVERVARTLGMRPILCDPPKARETGDGEYRPLEELCDCDVLTLHVPLTRKGRDATAMMINAEVLESMAEGAALINASRGGVVDEAALSRLVQEGHLSAAALDAWVGEPSISLEVLHAVDVATPHIAGYSTDAKLRGTEMILREFYRLIGEKPQWDPETEFSEGGQEVEAVPGDNGIEKRIAALVERAYPIKRDDRDLRKIVDVKRSDRGAYFDSLRKYYPVRREFAATRVVVEDERSEFARAARGLGFAVVQPGNRAGAGRRRTASPR